MRPVVYGLIIMLLITNVGLIFGKGVVAEFIDRERIELKLDDVFFSGIMDIDTVPGGFILLISRTPHKPGDLILKVDSKGKLLKQYEKRGYGPGEIKAIRNIVVTEDSIYAIESTTPFVHEYSHDLVFKKDYRVKRGGKLFDAGKYMGIWNAVAATEKGQSKKYALSLYNKEKFSFVRYAFPIKKEPFLVQGWGGICKANGDSFAGVYVNEYYIRQYDPEFLKYSTVNQTIPGHIKKYVKWTGEPNSINNKALSWMESWTKMHSIFWFKNYCILRYLHDGKNFIDVYTSDGVLICGPIKENDDISLRHFDGSYFWMLEEKELKNADHGKTGDINYTLIKAAFRVRQTH